MKNQRRIKLAVRRSLRARALGGKYYDKARKELELARNLGLLPNQPIELEMVDEKAGTIELRRFILVNNFDRDVAYKTASVQHYELKPLAKNPRSPKPDTTE